MRTRMDSCSSSFSPRHLYPLLQSIPQAVLFIRKGVLYRRLLFSCLPVITTAYTAAPLFPLTMSNA